jgi:hypothetical protein
METIIGPIVLEKRYYKELRKGGISYIQCREGRVSGLVTSCFGVPSKTPY